MEEKVNPYAVKSTNWRLATRLLSMQAEQPIFVLHAVFSASNGIASSPHPPTEQTEP